MSFLALILIVVLEKLTSLRALVQRDGLWLRCLAYVEAHQCAPWLAHLLLVGLPLAVLALVLLVIEQWLYGWLALPVHLLVLLYSVGRGDMRAALGPCKDALRRGDGQGALYAAERDLGIRPTGELLPAVQEQLVWRAYEGFFAVIFWYALLGPIGALGYRLVALSAQHSQAPTRKQAMRIRHALDWLACRVFALSVALVGHFAAVNQRLMHELLNLTSSAQTLVTQAALAACDQLPEDVDSLAVLWLLIVRATVLWYAGLALLAIVF